MADFWQSTLLKGRKEHRCATCGAVIPKGDESYKEAGVTDGDFSSYRSCAPCHDLVQRLYAGGHLSHEPWLLCDLPEIAHYAGEAWPPTPSPITPNGA